MELIIVKDEHIFARATDSGEAGEYSLNVVADADIPTYPTENPPKGKQWELDYVDGELAWVLADRPLTVEERLEAVEEKQNAWKAGEWVEVGDRRFYDGHWYKCIQAHTTQTGWEPPIVPALWQLDD